MCNTQRERKKERHSAKRVAEENKRFHVPFSIERGSDIPVSGLKRHRRSRTARVFMYLLKVRVAFLCRTVVFEPPFTVIIGVPPCNACENLTWRMSVFTKKYSSN